jgi:hypothetical protein
MNCGDEPHDVELVGLKNVNRKYTSHQLRPGIIAAALFRRFLQNGIDQTLAAAAA